MQCLDRRWQLAQALREITRAGAAVPDGRASPVLWVDVELRSAFTDTDWATLQEAARAWEVRLEVRALAQTLPRAA